MNAENYFKEKTIFASSLKYPVYWNTLHILYKLTISCNRSSVKSCCLIRDYRPCRCWSCLQTLLLSFYIRQVLKPSNQITAILVFVTTLH